MMNVSKCSKCFKVPDDILMLTCSHDLCLPCAAKSFSVQQPAKRGKKVVFKISASSLFVRSVPLTQSQTQTAFTNLKSCTSLPLFATDLTGSQLKRAICHQKNSSSLVPRHGKRIRRILKLLKRLNRKCVLQCINHNAT